MRLNFEKSMTRSVLRALDRCGKRSTKEYKDTGLISGSLSRLSSDLDKIFKSHYTSVINKFGDRVFENRKFERFQDIVGRYIQSQAGQKIAGISAYTGRQITSAILAGEAEGEGVDSIARRIQEKTSGAVARSRAATIARTETHAAASYATHEATKQMGLPAQRKRWVSVSDGRTREHHRNVNGQEVGIDEKFVVQYRGQEILMDYPHDGSGGAGNNVNCRCLSIYFTDEDALFDSFDEEDAVSTPEISIEPPEEPPSVDDPFGENAPFKFPSEAVTIVRGTLTVAAAKRKLGDYVSEGLKDRTYERVGRWQGDKDAGKATLGTASKEAYNNVTQAVSEMEYFGTYINVPKLRGVTSTRKKRINGSMGGGVLNLNKDAVDAYTLGERGLMPKGNLEELRSQQRDARAKVQKAREDYFDARNQRLSDDEQQVALKALREVETKYFEILEEIKVISEISNRGGGPEVSTYKFGDDIATRPWSTKEYFEDGLDKTRALVYHEFGHHIHQTYKLGDKYVRNETPIERRLEDFWRRTDKADKEYYAPSTYAMTNSKEYFVESFAMYMLKKKDVMHPEMRELIEEIINERGK